MENFNDTNELNDIIRKYNLSPIETIMLSFDIVRYYKENCYGLFERILKSNNIDVHTYQLFGTRITHSRSVIYVKDPKYDINGIYFFDINWSLKDGLEDQVYKYNYNYFAKTKEYFDSIDKAMGFDDYYIGDFSYISDEFADLAFIGEYDEISKDYIESINNLSEIVDNGALKLEYQNSDNLDIEATYEKINSYDLLLYKPICGEKLLEILFNVSKIKYIEGLSLSLDLEYLKYTFFNSNWSFKEGSIYDRFRNNNYPDDESRMAANVYGLEDIDTIFKTIDFYSEVNGLDDRIKSLKNESNVKRIKIV